MNECRSASAGRIILSLLLKCAVIFSAALGIYISARASSQTFMGGNRVYMYFTIQSNIAIALICLIGGIRMALKKPQTRGWMIIQFMGAVAISLTGLVFCFILAPTLGKYAWELANVLTHVIVPIAAVADFFFSGARGCLTKQDAVYGLLPPLAYVIYAGIGYIAGWQFSYGARYPYFFLNWGSPAGAFGFINEIPFMGCFWWILALCLLLVLLGLSYIALLNFKKSKMST